MFFGTGTSIELWLVNSSGKIRHIPSPAVHPVGGYPSYQSGSKCACFTVPVISCLVIPLYWRKFLVISFNHIEGKAYLYVERKLIIR
jgi:hypothetical protein